jgi:hypothetical protein
LDLSLLGTLLDFFLEPESFDSFVFSLFDSFLALFRPLLLLNSVLVEFLFLDDSFLFFFLLVLVFELF